MMTKNQYYDFDLNQPMKSQFTNQNAINRPNIKTRGPQALMLTWVLETLHRLFVRKAHICISTAPS